ncbi:putative membrane protein [Heliorestis convoluta]|uniref:Putative membrane protein n=1 Tax=Heliorestis convoluta TaxID=356322 RepID=A0A5Q2MXU6_9FIRM|nr:putative membrane protein [Heliorestis convoluta]
MDRMDEGLNFFKGLIGGTVIVVPLWALIVFVYQVILK